MFLECRLLVQYESDKKTMKVPLEFVKGHENIEWSEEIDPSKIYEVFWSSQTEDTPSTVEAIQTKVINVDDALKNATKPKERRVIQGSAGYYYARILAVKDNLKQLDQYLENKEGRRASNAKAKDSEPPKRQRKPSDPIKLSKSKLSSLVRAGANESLKRGLPPDTLEVKQQQPKRLKKRDVLEEKDFSSEDSDDEISDETVMPVNEHRMKLEAVESEWKEKVEKVTLKYNKYKQKFNFLYDTFLECHKLNLELEKLLVAHSKKKINFTYDLPPFVRSSPKDNNHTSSNDPPLFVRSSPKDNNHTSSNDPPIHSKAPLMSTGSLFSDPHPIKSVKSKENHPVSIVPASPQSSLPTLKSNEKLKKISPTVVFKDKNPPLTVQPTASQVIVDVEVHRSSSPTISTVENLTPSDSSPNLNQKYRMLTADQLKLASRGVASGKEGDSCFVRNTLEIVFDEEVLLVSSAQGKKANNQKNIEARPALDKDGFNYVKDLLRDRIIQEWKQKNPEEEESQIDEGLDVAPRLKKFVGYVNGKISAVRKTVFGLEKKIQKNGNEGETTQRNREKDGEPSKNNETDGERNETVGINGKDKENEEPSTGG